MPKSNTWVTGGLVDFSMAHELNEAKIYPKTIPELLKVVSTHPDFTSYVRRGSDLGLEIEDAPTALFDKYWMLNPSKLNAMAERDDYDIAYSSGGSRLSIFKM